MQFFRLEIFKKSFLQNDEQEETIKNILYTESIPNILEKTVNPITFGKYRWNIQINLFMRCILMDLFLNL